MIEIFTWMTLSLQCNHLNDCIVAARDRFVALTFIDVDGFDFPVLRADVNDILVHHRPHHRTDHRIVLNDSFKEQRFHSLQTMIQASTLLEC